MGIVKKKKFKKGDIVLLSVLKDCGCGKNHKTTTIISKIEDVDVSTASGKKVFMHKILSIYPRKFNNDKIHWTVGDAYGLELEDWEEAKVLSKEEIAVWQL